MIITISQALEGQYNIDVFGTLRRGGSDDNMNFLRVKGSRALESDLEWIKTTLNTKFTNAKSVIFEWIYNGYVDGKETPPKKGQKISYAPGGSYLSNEIFYRVAKLRKDNKPSLSTGHFHISKIQNNNEDLKQQDIEEVLNIVSKGISEGVKGL
ncbi:MAG: hypothetical protein ACK5MD_05850 [Flavobacteriales bacterium]